MNVFQYFQTQISTNHLDDCTYEFQDWSKIPLDSECGGDCKSAIDATSKLIENIQKAFGKGTTMESDLIDSVVDILNCFVNG